MKIPEDTAVYEAEVPFHDCDPLGIVWHGHYYKYLEIARTRLLAGVGLDVRDFLELGYGLLVIESRCRYAFPLRYGDRFRVRAWFKDTEMRLNIAYEVTNLTRDKRAARGWTVLVVTDDEGNMLMETPDEIRRRIDAGPVARH